MTLSSREDMIRTAADAMRKPYHRDGGWARLEADATEAVDALIAAGYLPTPGAVPEWMEECFGMNTLRPVYRLKEVRDGE